MENLHTLQKHQLHPGSVLDSCVDQFLTDDLFSAPKISWSFSNSDLRHLWHSSDSDCLPVLETLWSTSYSKPLPAVPNTTMCSFYSDPLSDTTKVAPRPPPPLKVTQRPLWALHPPVQTLLQHSLETLWVVVEIGQLLQHPILRVVLLK